MIKILKYLFYIVACAFVFMILVKNFTQQEAEPVLDLETKKEINIYLGNGKMGSAEDCSMVFPVARRILNAETLGLGALDALLNGPTEKEKAEGYSTSINDNVRIRKFEVIDGVAYVDFDSRFNENIGGSCRVQAIMSQIENTLNVLPKIDSVVISVNDQTEGILEP